MNQLSAEIFEIQGRYDEAAAECRKAIRKSARTLNPHYRLGRALLLRSHDTEALTALARYRSRAEEHAVAAKLLERAVEIQPESESAWYALMVAYRNAGRRDDALRAKGKLDALRESPEGELTDFLRRIGERPQP